MKLVVRLLINAVAIWIAAWLLPGITLTSDPVGFLVVVLIFAVVNALIRPLVLLLTLPLSCITLGLFTFVVNAAMLMLTAWLAGGALDIGTTLTDQLVNAFLGALVISLVSTLLSWLVSD